MPLNEAWQSGAWDWSSATRKAYANDLGYKASLIAVSAHSNRSKGDQEPQDWMPERASYACTYLKAWVAVKWRWHLAINAAERRYLAAGLKSCGWPRVPKPARPPISTGSTATGGGGGGGSTGDGTDPGTRTAMTWWRPGSDPTTAVSTRSTTGTPIQTTTESSASPDATGTATYWRTRPRPGLAARVVTSTPQRPAVSARCRS
jgi:Protein of unknown function (DUF1524)